MSDAIELARASNACSAFGTAEFTELKDVAAQYLSTDGQFMRLMAGAGKAAQVVVDSFPDPVRDRVADAAQWALEQAYAAARSSQGSADDSGWWNRRLRALYGESAHRVSTMISGGVGGFFGLAGTLADLPVTTTLILRSVQQIAGTHGFDTADPAVRADCLTVFGMGGPMAEDDAVDTGLWAVRVGMARMLTPELLASIAASEAFRQVVQRFGVVVTQKMLTQAAPMVGAVVGATVNPVFTSYYQTMAHVHFRLRKLEQAHDPDMVRACFERVVRALREGGA